MYEIGDLIIVKCLIYEVQKWISCRECSFGYDEEQECLAPYVVCKDNNGDLYQFKYIRGATDQECLDYADWDVVKKSDDEQLIML